MRLAISPALALVAFALVACTEGAATPGASNQTAEERELEQQVRSLTQVSRNIVVSNTVQGAVTGALAGCGIGLLFGGDRDDCLRGAAVGGVAGGVIGHEVGQQAASVNRELVRQDEIISNLTTVNTRLNTVAVSLRNVVRAQNAEIASLRRQVGNQQVPASAYESRVRSINANRQAVIDGLAASESNVRQSHREIVELERQGGQSLSQSRGAAVSTEQRLAALRTSVRLIPAN